MVIGNILTKKRRLHERQPSVLSVAPTTTIEELTQQLTRYNVGALVVLNNNGALAGIISERDVVRAIARRGSGSLGMTAGALMTREVKTVMADTTVTQALAMMKEGNFRHLPVIDRGKVAGVVSIRDLLETRVIQTEHEVDTMKSFVVGSY